MLCLSVCAVDRTLLPWKPDGTSTAKIASVSQDGECQSWGSARRRKGGWFHTASPPSRLCLCQQHWADVGAPALGRLRTPRHVFSMVNPGLIIAAFSLATCSENLTHLPGSASSRSLHAPLRCPQGARSLKAQDLRYI